MFEARLLNDVAYIIKQIIDMRIELEPISLPKDAFKRSEAKIELAMCLFAKQTYGTAY
jgi:hypothetical protein